MLIIVEGIDGAGKTSVVNEIKKFIEDSDFEDVHIVKMPSNNKYGISVRKEIDTGILDNNKFIDLLTKDFNHTYENQIEPMLNAGKTVICDRYAMSYLAYQKTKSYVDDLSKLKKIKVARARLIILLDLDPEIALERIKREKDAIESRGINYFNSVRASFLRIAEIFSNSERFKIIDASREKEKVLKDAIIAVKTICL